MALDIDYLKQAKQYLEPDQFGQDRLPDDTERAKAYALVAIAEAVSKLEAPIVPDVRTDEQKQEQARTAAVMVNDAAWAIMNRRITAVRDYCEEMIRHDHPPTHRRFTDRAWACRTILSMLDGRTRTALETKP